MKKPLVKLASFTGSTAFLLLIQSAFAATQTWTNTPADQNWASAANWISQAVPVGGDTVVFNDSSITNLNNNLGDATSLIINFNLTTNSTYTITNTGNSITLGGNITDSSSTPVSFLGGTFWLPASRTFSILPGGNLIVGSVISNSVGNNTLTLAQNIVAPNQFFPATVAAGVVIPYGNPATFTLSSPAAGTFTNTTTISAGTILALDFANMATPVNLLSTNAVVMNGGGYSIKGKSTGSTFQTNAGNAAITFGTGGNVVALNPNGGAGTTLKLGNTWTRNSPATLNIDISAGGTIAASPALVNGVLGYATVKDATGNGFATTNPANAIVRYTTATTLDPAANSVLTNYITTGNLTMAGASFGVNSLTLDATSGNGVYDLGGAGVVMTNSSHGILMTGGNNYTIQNGQIATNNGEIIIHQMGAGTLTLNAQIGAGTASITKNGNGTLLISSLSTNSGTSVINRGTVKLGGASTSGSGPFGSPTSGLTINAGGVLDLNGYNLTVGTYNANGFGMVTNSAGGAPAVITLGNGNNRLSGLGSTFWAGNVAIKIVGNNGTRDDFGGNFASAHTGGTIYQGNQLADRVVNPYVFGYGPVTFAGNGGISVPSAGTSFNTGSFTNGIVVTGSGNVFNFQASVNSAGPWTGSGTLTLNQSFTPTFNWSGDISGFQGTIIAQGNGTVPNYTIGYVNANNSVGGSAQAVFDLQVTSSGNSNFQYNNTNTPATVRLGDLNTAGSTGSGVISLRNAAANTAVTFEVGALNVSSTFAGNIINNAAGSAVGITKVGTGNWTLAALNGASATPALSYTGPTIISNGILTVNGALSSSPVNVFGPGGLAGSGTISTPVTLNAGNAGILLTNNAGATLTLNGGLTLSNANVLAFDIGTSSDQITLGGGTFAQNGTATIYIAQTTGFGAGAYNLITGAAGITNTSFTLGNSYSGYSMVLTNIDASTLALVVSVTAPPTAYWHNRSGTSWTTINNWDTDQSSGTPLVSLPTIPTDVTFAANAASAYGTTLGADFSIHSLTLSTPNNVTIGGANTLTLSAGLNNSGASNVINAKIALITDQTWINSAGNPLTVNSNISGAHILTINDNGNGLVLNGVNTYSGGTMLTSGTLVLGNSTNTLADAGLVSIDGSGTLALGNNNDTVGAVAVGTGSITGTGGTLTAASFTLTNATVSANLAGTGTALTVNGVSSLAGTNSYTGTTTVNSGASLTFSGNNSLAAGAIADNGILNLVSSPNAVGASQVITVASGGAIYLKADGSTTFTSGGINAGTTLGFNVDQANIGINGSTLALNGSITWSASGTTLSVDGGNNYNLSLGDLYGGNGGNATISANSANLTIHSFSGTGNSSGIVFSGPQNINVTGGFTNAPGAKGMGLTFNGFGVVTLWGVDALTGSGPVNGTAFTVNSGRVILNNIAAVSSLRGNPTIGKVNGDLSDSGASLLLGGTDVNGLAGGVTLGKNIIVVDGQGNGLAFGNNGPMILGGQNTSGINFFSGTVTLGSSTNIGINATLVAAAGGEVDFTGAILKNGVDASAGLTINGDGNSGVIKLLGANNYAGLTTVSGGKLLISTFHAGGGDFTVNDGATLSVTNAQNAASAQIGNFTLGSSGPTTNRFDNVASTTVPVINASGAVTRNGSCNIAVGTNSVVNTGSVYPLIKYGSLAGAGSFILTTLPSGVTATLTNDLSNSWIALNVTVGNGVNTTPTNMTSVVNNGNLELSWPADHAGWHLQAQTNAPATGLSTNWVTVPNSNLNNHYTNAINTANGTVFYRMVYP